MNFRTTLVLLVVLAVVGLVILFTRDTGTTPEKPPEAKLLNINAADITRISIGSDDGTKTVLERADGKWRLIEPVKAQANDMNANALASAIAGLQSRGQIASDASTGLD